MKLAPDMGGDGPSGRTAPRDDRQDLAAEVGRDLDRIFAAHAPVADPPPRAVRVAFVERDASGGLFGRLTLRDGVLAASAAVAGVLAGVALAPRWMGTTDRPAPAREAGAGRAPSATPSEILAMPALAGPVEPSQPSPAEARPAPAPPSRSVQPAPASAAAVARPAARPAEPAVPPPPRTDDPSAVAEGDEPLRRLDPEARSCADMPTLADEMICDTPRLAAAQDDLNAAYAAALAATDRPAALRREQADWLDLRDVAARRSTRALEQLYRRRTEELWRRADEDRFADGDGPSWLEDRR